MKMNNSKIILEVKNLKKYFPLQKDIFGRPQAYLRAVDNVSFKLEKGKTIGVVGESGCGKTTLGRTILQLYDTTGGKSIYYGHTIEEVKPKYYVKGIDNMLSYQKRYLSLKEKLSNLLKGNDKYSYILDDEKVSLNDYTFLSEKISSESKVQGLSKDEVFK